jgi:sugar O-acyltransferase (sialic acid O-acetyltransferase NeuD family)
VSEKFNPIFVVGDGGFAAEVFNWVCSSVGRTPDGFVVKDKLNSKSPIADAKSFVQDDLLSIKADLYIAIGNPSIRSRVAMELKQFSNFNFPNLVHSTAIIGQNIEMGQGNLLLPFSIICPLVKLGSFNILNLYSSIGHEGVIGNFNTLSPYATLSGCAHTEDLCFIGSHATLGPGVKMKNKSQLAANSFGSKDIPENGLAFGVPAKVVGRESCR